PCAARPIMVQQMSHSAAMTGSYPRPPSANVSSVRLARSVADARCDVGPERLDPLFALTGPAANQVVDSLIAETLGVRLYLVERLGQRERRRPSDLLGIPARALGQPVEFGGELGERSPVVGVPDIGEAGDQRQRPAAPRPADPDGRVRLLHGDGTKLRAVETHPSPFVRHDVAGEQSRSNLQLILEQIEPLACRRELDAQLPMFRFVPG